MGVLVNYALMLSVGFAGLVSKMVCSLESSYLFGIRNKAHTIFVISDPINRFYLHCDSDIHVRIYNIVDVDVNPQVLLGKYLLGSEGLFS
jgi:hypothetical protein